MRGQHQQATGEVAALRYVNASLRSQLDDFVRAMAAANAAAPASTRAAKRGTPPGKADKPGRP